ncbi:hypothetical protein ABPG77_000797 [Micractinium sp. CCAP 211/92]
MSAMGRAVLRSEHTVAAAAAGGAAVLPQPDEDERQRVALLDWLVRSQGAEPSCLKVERRWRDEAFGWCLVATTDIEPEEVILSVPLTAAITSDDADESRWSAAMAGQLLQRQAAAEAAVAAGDAAAAERSGQPWLNALPDHVDLPWLYWSDAELAELQDEDTIAEARQFQAVFEAACEELGGAHSRAAVAWALSMVHSRSFVERSAHIWCPGIDLCNHTLTPNADIRCIHSPGSCQGGAAVDEVCPPEAAAAARQEPSRFELVTGEAGIAAGEEVTISYGSWPSDVFLLFFGFAPRDNPNDSAVIFYDLFDLASFKLRSVDAAQGAAGGQAEQAEQGDEVAEWDAVAAEVQRLEAAVGPQEGFFRMVATANGLDARLMHAAQALLAAGRGSPDGRPMSLGEFLQRRCEQLLDAYPTTLEEDEALLARLEAKLAQQRQAAAEGQQARQDTPRQQQVPTPGEAADVPGGQGVPPRLEQLAMAVTYRAGKKRVLRSTLAAASAALQQGRGS